MALDSKMCMYISLVIHRSLPFYYPVQFMENQKQSDDDQITGKYESDNNDDFVFVEDTMLSMDSNDLSSAK